MGQVITLTTDFGLKDGYVAAMKGAVLDINPNATLIDVSHCIAAQSVREAAFVLGTAYRYFPPGTIHLVVVDPGVGTGRRALALSGSGYSFIAPDNGALSYILADVVGDNALGSSLHVRSHCLPDEFQAVSLTNSEFWRPEVSSTFHGRDIFAPVAAHLSLGMPLEALGEPVSSVMAFPRPAPVHAEDGSVRGEVIHIDSFGNLITNLRAGDLPGDDVQLEVAGHTIKKVSTSYQQKEGLLTIVGSSGYLEIAESNGSAARRTGSAIGTQVIVRGV